MSVPDDMATLRARVAELEAELSDVRFMLEHEKGWTCAADFVN